MDYLKPARKQLTSPETSQELTDILWKQPYLTNFLQEFEAHVVEHSLLNKAIQLTECTCSKFKKTDHSYY